MTLYRRSENGRDASYERSSVDGDSATGDAAAACPIPECPPSPEKGAGTPPAGADSRLMHLSIRTNRNSADFRRYRSRVPTVVHRCTTVRLDCPNPSASLAHCRASNQRKTGRRRSGGDFVDPYPRFRLPRVVLFYKNSEAKSSRGQSRLRLSTRT